MYKTVTNKAKYVQNKTLIVGVDISKDHLSAYGRGNGQETNTFEVTNNYEGLSIMWANLRVYQIKYGCEQIILGFESTGHYSEPLKNFMSDKNVKLVQVNPMHTKRVKHLNDRCSDTIVGSKPPAKAGGKLPDYNSPGSTDQKDPRVIVDIIQLGHYLSLVIPVGPSAELRSLTYARESLLQEKIRILNRLESLVFRIFPEFLQTVKHMANKTSRYLLNHYPTAHEIKWVSLEQLTKEIKKVSRGQLGQEMAERLKQTSEISLGTKEGRDGILYEIEYILDQIDRIEIRVNQLEEKMKEQIEKIPYAKKLLSIKGIGIVILSGLVGEVGDFRDYRKQSELVKLAGLDIYEISSGKYRGQRHISKCGRWLLRKLLYFASLNVIRQQGIMRDYYQRLTGRGMVKTKALIAVSRKLLRTIFAMVRDGTEYKGVKEVIKIKTDEKESEVRIPA
jgi:transposase